MKEVYAHDPRHATAAAGAARHDAAHERLAKAQRAGYIMAGQRALLRAMLRGDGTVTADDVRRAVDLPAGVNPVVFGPVPVALAHGGIIAADGFVTTCRSQAHARPTRRWRLVDRPAALAWLAAHPEPVAADLFSEAQNDIGTQRVER